MEFDDKVLLPELCDDLQKGLERVFDAQYKIATERLYYRGQERRALRMPGKRLDPNGFLPTWLQNHSNFVTQIIAGRLTANISYPTYIRFIDMKEHGNYQIYNRQLWGILFSDTFNKMGRKYMEHVQPYYRQLLNEALGLKTPL